MLDLGSTAKLRTLNGALAARPSANDLAAAQRPKVPVAVRSKANSGRVQVRRTQAGPGPARRLRAPRTVDDLF